ncbi:hypothetical protein [Desmospora profundinema]|uniref:Fe-S cluster assembly iron-binding protein IscA n=1 Tax=Desmospora profundinema TaxID=1571184 RepID=A0ABU1IMI6_9BACL|nr:hypothetical protein [Desmospora profundinema]MDR6225953.1 Fe-S cluster assembly iron-binding protein IscA [Desmospora profundinema]
MDIQISRQAAARLTAILMQEPDADRLAVRVVPLTSGCSTPSFALELTEVNPGSYLTEAAGVPFTCPPAEKGWLDGIVIDWRKETDSFSIYHPSPPFSTLCPIPSQKKESGE